MDRKRSYDDGCAFAQALDLVGERWALLVMRELMFGPKRFTDLKEDLPGIATNMLTQRLLGLEAAGIIQQVDLPRPARGKSYALTPWGLAFREPLRVIGAWASRSPHLCFEHRLSAAAAMLSLGSMFDEERAGDLRVAVDVRLPDGDFAVAVEERRLSVEPGRSANPDCIVTGDQNAMLPVLYAGKPVEAALADGSLKVEGDKAALERLAQAFRSPEPMTGSQWHHAIVRSAPMTPVITVFKQSPDRGRGLARDMRVRWALEEVGQPYEVRLVSFAEMKGPAHRSLHPFGQIPTYEEGGLVLFESGAIVLHIAEHHPGLLPEGATARARATAWMFAALSTVEPPILELAAAKLLESDKPWTAERLPLIEDRIRVRLSELSSCLGEAEWLMASSPPATS
jgi:glutathione S-transferase